MSRHDWSSELGHVSLFSEVMAKAEKLLFFFILTGCFLWARSWDWRKCWAPSIQRRT